VSEGPPEPKRGPGRPKGSKTKPKDGAAAGAADPEEEDPFAGLTPELLASMASGLFSFSGKMAGASLAKKLHEAGYEHAKVEAGRKELAESWALTDKEATAIGKTARRYIETLTDAPPPWLGFAIAFGGPVVIRGVLTYAVFHGLKQQNRSGGPERAGEKPSGESAGGAAPASPGR
jgi:hypothetical protein